MGAKALLTLAPGKFVRVAEAGWAFVAPLKVVTAPAPMVLVRLPFTVMVAFNVMVHEVDASKTPPVNVKVLLPTTPVRLPPQVPVLKMDRLAIIVPAGILSVKRIPVRGSCRVDEPYTKN